MPRPDALTFLGELAGDDRFHDLVTTRWAKGSWRLHTQIIWTGDAFTSSPFVQIYFPKQQITAVVKALNDHP